MDIIRFLKDQHQKAKDVLNQIIVEKDANGSRSLLETMSKMLLLHMQIEETIVYPAASRCFQGDIRKPSVLQSFEEHELARECLSALQSTPPNDEHFVAHAKVLKGLLREHIFEEESELFPSLATKLGQAGIDMLGKEAERQLSNVGAKAEAEPAPQPASAAEAPATRSPSAKATRTRRPATKSRSAKVAQTRRPATKSRSAKVAQTRRKRSPVRGAKARRKATASRSSKRH